MAIPVQELFRYVPTYVTRRVAAHPELKAHAFADRWHSATLFADISGFTPLSEKLGARGAEGVETLTSLLNSYFGQIINIIHGHGGDIGRFAGDALLAFWVAEDPAQVPELVKIAAQCGMLIQEAMTSFHAPAGEKLGLRVGIGAGDIFTTSLGGVFERYDCIVSGEGVIEAGKSAASLKPGSVVAGENAWKVLGPIAAGEPVAPGYTKLLQLKFTANPTPLMRPDLPQEGANALLAYIPAGVHRRLAAGQSAFIAEFRRVTVLFISLHSMDHHVALDDAQRVMQAVQEELYRFHGSLNKLGADEKGATCVAALGLPPVAHEDDEVRAALVGFNVHARLKAMDVSCSVGVNSGTVFCGTVGNTVRCEYSMIADTVNFTARLMAAAKGGVLCGESTFRRAQRRVAWETLEPIMVKGKATPMAIFRPTGAARATLSAAPAQPMVGRERERRQIAEFLAKITVTAPATALVLEGPAGMGKSRLLEDLLASARTRELKSLRGLAESLQRTTPYYAWRDVFAQLLALDPAMAADDQRARVMTGLEQDAELKKLAPLMGAVLALDWKDNEHTEHLFGEGRVTSTRRLLLELIRRRCTSEPLLLVLEDTHWMDSASWMLAAATKDVPGLALVMPTRPLEPGVRDALPPPAQALLESARTTWLELAPLSGEESLQLVAQKWGVPRLPEQVAEVLRSRAQGNPFFAEELAAALLATGKVKVENGACTVPADFDPEKLALPDSVQGVVTSRIDRLEPPEQLTLKVASVVGGSFPPHLLRDVCPVDEDRERQDRNLAVLVDQQLLDREPEAAGLLYRFHHAITREVAYQLMPPGQRKSLHQAVAEWYEQTYTGDLTPYFALLARHWSNTDQTARALDYLELSGQNALRHYANDEAVAFFTQAIEIAKTAGNVESFRLAGWQRQVAEAHYNLGHLATSLTHFGEALKLLEDPFPETLFGFARATLWEMFKQALHRLAPVIFYGRAGRGGVRKLEAARAYERLAQIRYLNNHTLATVHASFKSLNLSESYGDSPELARSYGNAAVVHGLLMLHPVARAHAARATAVAATVRQPPCDAYVSFINGVYWVTVGAWEQARESLQRAVTIAERIGETRRWFESAFTLANTLSRMGEYARSAAVSAEIHAVGRRKAVPQAEVWGLSWELLVRFVVPSEPGQLARLNQSLSECLAAHPDIPLADQILGLGVLGLAAWRRGDAVEARARVDAALDIALRTGVVSHYLLAAHYSVGEVYVGLARAATDPAERAHLESRARRVVSVLQQFCLMYPVGKPRLWMVRALLADLNAAPAKSQAAWTKALESAESLRMPAEEMVAHRALAQLAAPGSAEARTHERRAAELLAQLAPGISAYAGSA